MKTRKFILRELCRNYREGGNTSLSPEEIKQRLRGLLPEYIDQNVMDLSRDSRLVEFDDSYNLNLNNRGIEACKRGELLDVRLRPNREPKYQLKSRKASNVSRAITQSLTGKSILSFLVFGPGKASEGYLSHRLPVKNLIEELNQRADFPEDIGSLNEHKFKPTNRPRFIKHSRLGGAKYRGRQHARGSAHKHQVIAE